MAKAKAEYTRPARRGQNAKPARVKKVKAAPPTAAEIEAGLPTYYTLNRGQDRQYIQRAKDPLELASEKQPDMIIMFAPGLDGRARLKLMTHMMNGIKTNG